MTLSRPVVSAAPIPTIFEINDEFKKSLFYCSLLALQFGLQPIIASRFTAEGVSKSSVVIATELGKILIAFVSIMSGPKSDVDYIIKNWSLYDSIKVAALPATLYALQNLFVQYGYVLLDSMTFNLLNQTKTLSAAFWLWILMGQQQSQVQMFSLLLLLMAAVVLNLSGSAPLPVTVDGFGQGSHVASSAYQLGLLCVAIASMLSGLSAALTQRVLVGAKQRHPFFFSAELAVYGIVFLLINLVFNNDIKGPSGHLFSNWDTMTLIPVVTNAFGGLVVGLVTKYAGGVVKGFALIAGIIITGVAQFLLDGKPLGMKDLIGVILVSLSIYLHSSYPIRKIKAESVVKKAD